MADRVPMTRTGYETLKQALHRLKTEERPENVKDIEEAIAHGDLSENAEYHAAKERQSHIAGRIASTEDKLARAQIIETQSGPSGKVQFGATVVLSDSETEEIVTYRIVGEDEADVARGLINVNSPIARAMIGKMEGDEILVKLPRGDREFELMSVEFKPVS